MFKRAARRATIGLIASSGFAGLTGSSPTPDQSRLVIVPEIPQCVVLIHGLLRSPKSFTVMEKALSDEGYHVINVGYESRTATTAELATPTVAKGLEGCKQAGASPVNFVTHSLGGILLRHHMSEHKIGDLNRVVMLGPPNQGSEIPDKLGNLPGYEWMNGPVGYELGTNKDSVPQSLPAANFEVGVIAGSRSINLVLSQFIPDTDDGKVSVERTKLDGMKDHIVMPVTHAMMMRNKTVIHQVRHFIENGQFDHKSPSETTPAN